MPSKYLKISSADLPEAKIHAVLDFVGYTCDELFGIQGRSTACVYFAVFLRNALNDIFNVDAKAIHGQAEYTNKKTGENFSWDHAWVEYSNQIVDGNVDSMEENPKVPDAIRPKNYWGLKQSLPKDRSFSNGREIDDEWIQKEMNYDEINSISEDLVSNLKTVLQSM